MSGDEEEDEHEIKIGMLLELGDGGVLEGEDKELYETMKKYKKKPRDGSVIR